MIGVEEGRKGWRMKQRINKLKNTINDFYLRRFIISTRIGSDFTWKWDRLGSLQGQYRGRSFKNVIKQRIFWWSISLQNCSQHVQLLPFTDAQDNDWQDYCKVGSSKRFLSLKIDNVLVGQQHLYHLAIPRLIISKTRSNLPKTLSEADNGFVQNRKLKHTDVNRQHGRT